MTLIILFIGFIFGIIFTVAFLIALAKDHEEEERKKRDGLFSEVISEFEKE